MLPYRRFFEISDLVGVRVEDPAVFRDVHTRALAMLADGTVDGLRIDHIDGLADPKGYLCALRDAGDAPYVVVERSEEHTSELQSLMRISYAVFCLKKKNSTAPLYEPAYN